MLTVKQAAAILGYDEGHVRRLIIQKKLKAKRFGGKSWMIERRDVEQYRQDHPRAAAGRPRKDAKL